MADLQLVKNQLMGLSYQEKIQMSEWLHTQIDFERGEEVKRKTQEVSGKLDSFLEKAATATKTGVSSLMDQFKKATDSTEETNTNLPTKH